MNIKTKRLLISIFGYLLISFALTINIKANVGKPPFNSIPLALYDIMSLKLGLAWITIGRAMIIVDLIVFLGLFLFYKTSISFFYPLLLAFVFGNVIDLWNFILPLPADFSVIMPGWARIVLMIGSLGLIAVGLSFIFLAKVVTTAVDLLFIATADITKIKFSTVLILSQFVFAAIAFGLMFISGKFGHITIIGFFFSVLLGGFVNLIMPFCGRVYNRLIN